MVAAASVEHDILPFIRGWLSSFNRGDWDAFSDLLTEDVTFSMPGMASVIEGREAVVASYRQWLSQFSALTATAIDGFGSPDRVAIQVVWEGTTHRRHRPLRFPACMLFRLRDHRIAEIIDYYDQLTYRRQTGESLRG